MCEPSPLCSSFASAAVARAATGIELEVDVRDVQRGIQHAHMTLPAAAGEMSLVYPKWIQGEHAPSGPIVQVTR